MKYNLTGRNRNENSTSSSPQVVKKYMKVMTRLSKSLTLVNTSSQLLRTSNLIARLTVNYINVF